MKVKDLIRALEDFDEDLEVKRYCEGIQFSIEYYNLEVVKKDYEENKNVLLIG